MTVDQSTSPVERRVIPPLNRRTVEKQTLEEEGGEMKTLKPLPIANVLASCVLLTAAFANADELKSATVPVEAAYCRQKFPATDDSSDPSMTIGPSLGQRTIDVYQFCNDDPLELDESSSYIHLMPVNVFGRLSDFPSR
jgi:hypothetical protein